jgi:hypothetical protein
MRLRYRTSHHERAGHRVRATNLAATAEKVVLATSRDAAPDRRKGADMVDISVE